MVRLFWAILFPMFVMLPSAFAHSVKFVNGGGQGIIDCSETGTYFKHINSNGRDITSGPKVEHFTPNTSGDPCSGKDCGSNNDRYNGGHGHKTIINGKVDQWSYMNCGGYAFQCGGSCDTTITEPIGEQTPPSSGSPSSERGGIPYRGDGADRYGHSENNVCDNLEYDTDEVCYEWDVGNFRYFGVPVLPKRVTTVGQLRSYIGRTSRKYLNLAVFVDGAWQKYDRMDPTVRDMEITPHLGLRASYSGDIGLVGIAGQQVYGEKIELTVPEGKKVGIYLIGFPETPANYPRLSDLLVDGVRRVIRKIKDGVNYRNFWVTRHNPANDAPIVPGMGVLIMVDDTVEFDFRGEVPAAPMAQRQDSLATSWGAMKTK